MSGPLQRAWSGVSRARVFTSLIVAHVVLKAAMWPGMIHARFTGDELAYDDAARALADLVRDLVSLHSPNLAELKANVISNGWFMPGMPIVLTPLYVVVPDPSVAMVRTYVGVLTSALLIAVALWVRRALGYRFACVLMVVPGLVPMWVAFSYTIFGDASAGLVVVALVVALYRAIAAVVSREPVPPRDGAVVGLLAIVALYLRSSALPASAGALVLLAAAVILFGRGQRFVRRLAAPVVAVVVFLVALAPWSIAASKAFDTRVTTTTTTNLSLAVTFGDTDKLCFGPCTPKRPGRSNIWFDAPRYSREVGAVTGQSELTVQQAMARYALRGLTVDHYVRTVRQDFHRYAAQPNAFAARFWSHSPAAVTTPTSVLYVAAGAVAALLFLDLRRLPQRQRITRMLVKLFLLAGMVQPFVHPCSGRYWPSFVALFGLAVGYAVTTWRPTAEEGDDIPVGSRAAARAVAVTDVAATALAVVVAAVLLAVGR